MCIMAAPVEHVGGTRILVAPLEGNLQLTCYANEISASSPNAMILPVPLPSPESVREVSLVNLQSVDYLFTDLQKAFPKKQRKASSRSKSRSVGVPPYLEVESCGSYKVSIAPTIADLKRIDRSQLPMTGKVCELLETDYGTGFAFIVCMFQKGEPMHPMAYISPIEDDVMFVPTKHEHGDSGDSVDWDHELYSLGCCNSSDGDDPGSSPQELLRSSPGWDMEWKRGTPVEDLAALPALERLLPAEFLSLNLRRKTITGDFDNRDVYFAVGTAAALCATCTVS